MMISLSGQAGIEDLLFEAYSPPVEDSLFRSPLLGFVPLPNLQKTTEYDRSGPGILGLRYRARRELPFENLRI